MRDHPSRPPARGTPGPERQSLATGFREVDRSGDTDACHRCLDLITGIPFFNEIKKETFRIMANTTPGQVLDAGCGAGTDLATLASRLPPGCQLTGLDASGSLLARAAGRTMRFRDRVSLVRGDLMQIPVRTEQFDACRIDRVLQHLHEPEGAIRELVRVIKPGGILIAFDNDWDTLSLSLDDQGTAGRIRRSWLESFASGRIGQALPGIFRESGLVDIYTEARTLALTDLPVAEQVYDLPHLLVRMEQAGTLAPGERMEVMHELHDRAEKGRFTSGYTGFIVWGKKPE
jgi:ubiquinone/menaquinone biosynthesis C-methylase UbiE